MLTIPFHSAKEEGAAIPDPSYEAEVHSDGRVAHGQRWSIVVFPGHSFYGTVTNHETLFL